MSVKNARNLSPEKLHFTCKCSKIRLVDRFRRDPLVELTSLPQTPSWIKGGGNKKVEVSRKGRESEEGGGGRGRSPNV